MKKKERAFWNVFVDMLPVDIFLQAGRGCDRAAFSGKIRKRRDG